MRFRIFYKFLFLILFFTLLPLIWLGINLINKAEYSIKTPISELHINLGAKIKKSIYLKIDKYNEISMMINNFFRSNPDWQSRTTLLYSILNSNRELKVIAILNTKGEEILKVASSKYKLDFRKTPDQLIFLTENGVVLIYNMQMYYLYFELDMESFLRSVEATKIGEKSSLFLIRNDFSVINLGGSNKILDCIIKDEKFIGYVKSQMDSTIEIRCGGSNYLGAITSISEMGVTIASLQDVSDAYKYAMSIRKDAIKVILIFTFAVVIVSYILSKKLSGPIIKLIKAAERVSEKDFSVRVDLKTKDELENLARTFNRMVENLDTYSKLQIEKILRERQNTQAIMYSTEDGIIMVDLNMSIQLINRKALSIIGCGEESVENKNIYDVIKDESVKEAVSKVINSEKKQFEFERDYKTYKRFYRVSLTEIKLRDKELIGYLITFYDITYDKELEKIKEDFLHSITHDLRNPVSAIKGFAEFLLKEIAGPLNQNQRNMILSIDRASFRLLGMVNNILDIAKIEAGKMEVNISRFNVYELVKKCIELMSSLALKKNISFVIDGEKNIEISADANLIERVYINLIGNAIKFTPQDGRITIGFLIKDDKFRSWVEDTGEGIPLEYIDRIFSKFEQVKGQKVGGTGLGLTISKHIIEAHLGKIWAEYRPNMGAKFVFEFPMDLKKNEFGKILSG